MLKKYFYNFLSYFINLILPLIYGSYIFKIFGSELNGKIAYLNTIIYYACFISSFSIQSFAIRELSKIRENKELLVQESSNFFSFTLFFSVVIFFLYLLISFFFIGESDFNIYFSAGLIILGNGINIDYLYQVREDFKMLSLRSLFLKSLLFVLIYFFIKDEADLVLYLLVLSSSTILSNIYLFNRLGFKINIHFELNSFLNTIKRVWKFHLMNSGMILYNKLPSFVFIFSASFTSIGIFSFAEKFLLTTLGISSILISTFQSRLVHIKIRNSTLYLKEYEILFILNMIILGVLTILFFNSSIYIQRYFGGDSYSGAVPLLKLGSILILISGTSSFITTLNLLPDGKEGLLFFLSLLSAIISFPIMFFLIFKFGAVGSVLGLLSSEFIMFLLVVYNSSHWKKLLQSKAFAYFITIFLVNILLFSFERFILLYLESQLIFTLFCIVLFLLVIFILFKVLFKSNFSDYIKPFI